MNKDCTRIILILLIIALLVVIFNNHKNNQKQDEPEILVENFDQTYQINIDNLTVGKYLNLMKEHNKILITLCQLYSKESQCPNMQFLLRSIIKNKNYEIILINELVKGLPFQDKYSNFKHPKYISSVTDIVDPNISNINFNYLDYKYFNYDDYFEDLRSQNHKLQKCIFVNLMIVLFLASSNLSKIMLRTTKNHSITNFIYRTIRLNQNNIVSLKELLKKNEILDSKLVLKN